MNSGGDGIQRYIRWVGGDLMSVVKGIDGRHERYFQ